MNDDLISRQAAVISLGEIYRWQPVVDMPGRELAEEIEEALLEVPTVPQKTGRWVPIKPLLVAARCSECKRAFTDRTIFCPNCGAKMEGSGE